MSSKHPDDQIFDFPYQPLGFDAEMEYGQRARRRGGCCGCGCCLGCLSCLLFMVLGIAALCYWIVAGGTPLVVSEETTVITEPLKADGTVDFHQALQAMVQPDIPPDENGFMIVWRGYGREILDSIDNESFRRQYLTMCDQFGIDPLVPPTWADTDAGLDAVQTAAAGQHYFIPLTRQSESDLVAMSQPFALYTFHERLSDAFRLRAGIRHEANDSAGAWQDILASLRLFRRVTIHLAWMRVLCENDGESLLAPIPETVAMLQQWTPQQLEQAIKDLESLPDWQDQKTMLKTIQFTMLDLLSVTNDFPGLGNRLGMELPSEIQDGLYALQYVGMDWNLVAKELNYEMDIFGEILERIPDSKLEEQFNQLSLRLMGEHRYMPSEEEWQTFMKNHLERTKELPLFASGRSRLIGAMLGYLGTKAAGEMFRLQLIEESRCQALRLALALERFHREHNQYPNLQEELGLHPVERDMHLQYEKWGDGYRIQNKVFEMSAQR